MSKAKFNLVVVAHPDDETLYFSGLLQSLRSLPWRVICVTDGNADGNGQVRHDQFMTAMKHHRVKTAEMWDFPDIYERRLHIGQLAQRLSVLQPQKVFTHGILGEYGHPHHQDVSMAVHEAYPKKPVLSVAYNCFPDLTIRLTARQFDVKTKVLSEVYLSETRRFMQFLPATATEGFARVSHSEVRALYQWLIGKQRPPSLKSKKYRWFFPHLEELARRDIPRPF